MTKMEMALTHKARKFLRNQIDANPCGGGAAARVNWGRIIRNSVVL
jgi:hypothetical protein